ncbi:MAG TPA: zinc ABC transporter substrate-binding protein [Beijerinckiaceae bacterium]|nr:zinc ABC transporter substrate-binding protein [Beijerinckiaceae bacterium]
MLTRRHALTWLTCGFALCTASIAPLSARAAESIKVVATFSILGDLVKNVGGDRVEITTLVGPNGDAHVFSPTPSDARRIADARLVVFNGLRFDGWITRLIKSSGTRAAVVEAAKGVETLAGKPGQGRAHGHAGLDPHAWQDIANTRIYVTNIRDGLAAADPAGKAAYEANAAAYLARLDALEAEVKAAIASLPAERRRIITSHDAFGYFARAYGLAFVAPQGVSTDAEASAKDVARIIQQIRREKIGAVFLENIADARLIERIARETGARIGDRLYSDALSGPDGPAATYIDMMRHNIRAFTAALSS